MTFVYNNNKIDEINIISAQITMMYLTKHTKTRRKCFYAKKCPTFSFAIKFVYNNHKV